jgi:hypothetical protein
MTLGSKGTSGRGQDPGRQTMRSKRSKKNGMTTRVAVPSDGVPTSKSILLQVTDSEC